MLSHSSEKINFPLLFSLSVEMALFSPQNCRGGRCMLMMQLFTAQFVGLLALLSNIAFAQFDVSEALTASASFPEVGITCLGNLAVFFSCLLRGRLYVEMGAKDLLDTIRPPKLQEINGCILTERKERVSYDVVMLSNHTLDSSIRQFMKYIKNTYEMDAILLQFRRLPSGGKTCIRGDHTCNCIVFDPSKEEYVTIILAERMPGTIKRLSASRCLLPCLTCLTNGCHGCNHGLLHVEVGDVDVGDILTGRKEWRLARHYNLTEGDLPKEWPAAAVCQILDKGVDTLCQERRCICIPSFPAEDDNWTKMLMRSLKTKDKEGRGVTNLASDHLKRYIDQSGVCNETEEYSTIYLILPRLTEVFINIILTGWFRVDGFSSSLVARRVVRDYIVDSRGTGIAANVFLTKCWVYSNAENTNVCQVFTLRGSLLSFTTLSSIIGCVNLICSIAWAVLIACPGKWYDTLSMAPSKARIVVVIAGIGIALGIDCLQLCLYCRDVINDRRGNTDSRLRFKIDFMVVMMLEIVCIISGTAVLGFVGIKAFGRWIYSALQVLVWVKWGFSSYFQGTYLYDSQHNRVVHMWAFDVSAGYGLMCASAFFLNAILAGVRGHWKYSQS